MSRRYRAALFSGVAAALVLSQPAAVSASHPATSIDLPVVIDGRASSNAEAFVSGEALIALRADDVAKALTGLADAKLVDALRARGADQVSVAELQSLGVSPRFDLARLLISIELNATSRAPQEVMFSSERDTAAEQIAPSSFSAGVTGAVTHVRNFGETRSNTSALELAGFMNAGGKGGYYLLFSGAFRLSSGNQNYFERGRIVGFKDDLKRVLRYSAGDLLPLMPRLLGDVALAGLGMERRYEDIQPLRNVRPTGARSFILERPSRVEVYANGALVKTFEAAPGAVDLRDIPALTLSSNISVIVEDSFGRRELDSFTLSNDLSMLAPGLSEFSVNAGVLRDDNFSRIRYSNDPVVLGEYRRGLSESFTAGGHLVLAHSYQNAGANVAVAALGGILFGGVAASHSDRGAGGAITLDFRGDPFRQESRNGQLTMRAEARSRRFQTLTTFGFEDRTKLDFAADYRFDIRERLSATFGGNYFSTYDRKGANWSAFAGLQANLHRIYVTGTARLAKRSDGERDHGVLFTVSVPIGRRHLLSATADTATGRARMDFRRRPDLEIPYFDYAATIIRAPGEIEGTLYGRYGTSRFETTAYVTQRSSDSATSILKLQSGLAYTDGKLAVGRDPGRGFVMVSRHRSLRNTAIDIFSSGTGRRVAQVNRVGPAVVPQIGSYRPETITFNLLTPPLGYDVGSGKFQTDPGAFSGAHILIGSDAYHSAQAVFVLDDGRPLSLRYGSLTAPDGHTFPIFTNSEGRAVIGELAPGHYTMEFEGYRARFTITQDSPAIVQLGTIVMERTQ